jgi:3-oxoacyl-[acyl-carrier protein] reductase
MNQHGSERETILIVGASSDIGREIIRRVAVGNPLILAHHNQSAHKLEHLGGELPGATLVPIRSDLAAEGEAERLAGLIRSDYPPPDKMVLLAAPKLEYVRFKDTSWELFRRELDVQLRSAVVLLQAVLPAMASKKKGKIVFVLSSVTLNIPPAALSHYVSAKYALWGLVRALAAVYSA